MEGAHVAALARETPRLPEGLEPGIYLLRPSGARGEQDMLVIR